MSGHTTQASILQKCPFFWVTCWHGLLYCCLRVVLLNIFVFEFILTTTPWLEPFHTATKCLPLPLHGPLALSKVHFVSWPDYNTSLYILQIKLQIWESAVQRRSTTWSLQRIVICAESELAC